MPLVSPNSQITFALSVRDRHASASWYADTLGFDVLYHADEVGWSELKTNTDGVTIGLGQHSEPVPGNAVPVFGVADLDTARAAMEQAGVSFDGETIVVEGMVKTATFYDPDKNALMMAEDLS